MAGAGIIIWSMVNGEAVVSICSISVSGRGGGICCGVVALGWHSVSVGDGVVSIFVVGCGVSISIWMLCDSVPGSWLSSIVRATVVSVSFFMISCERFVSGTFFCSPIPISSTCCTCRGGGVLGVIWLVGSGVMLSCFAPPPPCSCWYMGDI